MVRFAVVVNGVPGAGKTTLCRELGRELELPVLAKDAIKESLADSVDVRLPTSQLGALASDALWRMAGMIDGPMIVESFWFRGRDDAFFAAGLTAAAIDKGVELWCEAPVSTLRERFLTRPRHFAHHDASRMSEWEDFAKTAGPISPFPVVAVNTVAPIDVPRLAATVQAMIER